MIFVLFLSCNYIFMSFFCFFSFVGFFCLDWTGLDGLRWVGLVWSYFWSDRLGLRSFITFFMFMGYPKPICDFSGVVHFSLWKCGSVELCRYMSDESIFTIYTFCSHRNPKF